jgi:hypothetical protein
MEAVFAFLKPIIYQEGALLVKIMRFLMAIDANWPTVQQPIR